MLYSDLKNYLSGEYLETFQQIENNLTLHGSISLQMEERLEVLVDSLIEAQRNQEPVSKVIGDDLDLFMKELTADTSKVKKIFDDFFSILASISFMSIWMLIINYLFREGEKHFLSDKINIFPIFTYSLAIFVIGIVISTVFSKIYKNYKGDLTNKVLFWSVLPATIFYFLGIALEKKISIPCPVLPALIVLAIVILICLLYGIMNRRNIALLDKKERKETEELEKEEMAVVGKLETINRLIDIYNKENSNLLKKGKPLKSKEEYMAEVKAKDVKKHPIRVLLITYACVIAATVFLSVMTMLDPAPDSMTVGIVLLAFLLVAFSIFFIPAIFIVKAMTKNELEILSECEIKSLNIFELKDEIVNKKVE